MTGRKLDIPRTVRCNRAAGVVHPISLSQLALAPVPVGGIVECLSFARIGAATGGENREVVAINGLVCVADRVAKNGYAPYLQAIANTARNQMAALRP